MQAHLPLSFYDRYIVTPIQPYLAPGLSQTPSHWGSKCICLVIISMPEWAQY